MGIFGVVSESVLCDRLFDCFDSGSRGSINFAEYSSSLETMTKGGVNEKLEFAFKMMDSGSKGFIAMDDLSVMLQSVINVYYGMLGQPTRQVTAREVARIYMQLDQTGNGSVTISEFKTGVRKHPGMMTDFDRLGGTYDYDDDDDDAFESDGDGDGGGESAAESAAESAGEGRVASAMASMRLGPGGEEQSVLLHRGSVLPQRRPRFGAKSSGAAALLAQSAEDSAVFIAIATAKLERARLLSEKLCAAVPQPAAAAVPPPPPPLRAVAAPAAPADADADGDDDDDADGGDMLPDDPALLARALQLEIVKLQAELATHTESVRSREAALAKVHRLGRSRRRSRDAQSLRTPQHRLPSPMRSPTQPTMETPLRGTSWGSGLSSRPPVSLLESPPGRGAGGDGADGTTASDSEGGIRAASKSEPALKSSSASGAASGPASSQKLSRRVRQSTVGSARRAFKRRKRRQDRLSKRMMRSRDASKGEFLLFTVTFYANLAHSLTRSP
jgi:Ca2+-binding EF-hand superfamily protein